MDIFLWWSGVSAWAVLSSLGLLVCITYLIEQAIRYFGFYKTILQFAWDRAMAAAAKQRTSAG